MKKILTGSAVILLMTSISAHAQTYGAANNVKSHDSTLGSAKYVEPDKQAEAEPAPANIEPAAGDSTNYERSNFTGPYVGADANYSWDSADVINPAGPDGNADINGWGAGGFVGYGYAFTSQGMSGFYLGGELGYDWSSADGDVGGQTYEKNGDFQATLRPGYVFDNNMLGYGIAGYSHANFRADVNDQDEGFNGYVVGLGAEVGASWPVKARLEYTYSGYEDGDLGGINFDPHSNEVKLGLLYRFK